MRHLTSADYRTMHLGKFHLDDFFPKANPGPSYAYKKWPVMQGPRGRGLGLLSVAGFAHSRVLKLQVVGKGGALLPAAQRVSIQSPSLLPPSPALPSAPSTSSFRLRSAEAPAPRRRPSRSAR